MKTCSEMLREARESKGLLLEELAASTRISLHILQALESADFAVLPQTYVKGFLRNYARQLGLDPSEVVRTFEEQQKTAVEISAGPKKVERKPSHPIAWRHWVLPAVLVVVSISGFFLLRRADVQEPPQHQATGKEDEVSSPEKDELALPSPEEDEMAMTESDQDTLIIFYRDTMAPAPSNRGVPLPQGDSPAESSGAAVPADSADIKRAAAATPRPVVRLTLRAQAVSDTWLQVLCDGAPVFEGMLRSGATSGWEADSLFALKISKAGGVRLSLDGRPLGDLGPVNNVISSLIVNKNGIVKKVLK